MTEEWKVVVGYEGIYEVSNLGRVRSLDRNKSGKGGSRKGRTLALRVDKNGYQTVNLSVGGKVKTRKVHQLVLEAFVGPRPDGEICLHGDDVPSNNCLENLRWGTHAQNTADAIINGGIKLGELSVKAKLSNCDVKAIRFRAASGERDISICQDYGVSPGSIWNIRNFASRKFG